MSFENSPNFDDPDQIMELAHVIAEREIARSSTLEAIRSEIYEEDFTFNEKMERSRSIGRTTIYLAHLANPDYQPSFAELTGAIFGPDGFKAMAEDLYGDFVISGTDEPVLDESVEDKLREFYFEPFLENAQKIIESTSEHFNNELELAKEVANDHGVNLAEVYRQDELYYELKRSVEEDVRFAARAVASIMNLTPEYMRQDSIRALSLTPDVMIERFGTEIHERMAYLTVESEEAQATHIDRSEKEREIVRQMFVLEGTLIYGEEVVKNFQDEVPEYLAPTKPLTWAVEERLISRV